MSKSDDGGSAFPWTSDDYGIDFGMSLRDYFAGQALAGMTSDAECSVKVIAGAAYEFADAMLEQRKAEE